MTLSDKKRANDSDPRPSMSAPNWLSPFGAKILRYRDDVDARASSVFPRKLTEHQNATMKTLHAIGARSWQPTALCQISN